MALPKTALRKKALRLRNQGFSYSEIRKRVPVAKSTLSLWLRPVALKIHQKERLHRKLMEAQRLGAEARRKQRKTKEAKIEKESISQIKKINEEHLFLMGLMLYWAEGTKQSERNISQQVAFTNSDPAMCKLFLMWVLDCLKIPKEMIVPTIYIHKSQAKDKNKALRFWSRTIGLSADRFGKISLTNSKLSIKNPRERRNNYYGQLRLRVKRSADLNRKIRGWIKGACLRYGVI